MDLISPREAKIKSGSLSKLPFISRTSSQCWIFKVTESNCSFASSSLQLHKWSYLQADWKRLRTVLHILKELPNSLGRIWMIISIIRGHINPVFCSSGCTEWPSQISQHYDFLYTRMIWRYNNRNTFEPHRNTFNKGCQKMLMNDSFSFSMSAFSLTTDAFFICKIVPLK